MTTDYIANFFVPPYWTDKTVSSVAGAVQLYALLSEAFRLSLESWLIPDTLPVPMALGHLNCFTRANVDLGTVNAPHRVIARIAEIVLSAFSRPFVGSVPGASAVRALLLQRAAEAERQWIELPEILDYCWELGIPVIHVKTFGDTAKGMDAAVLNVEERPVIFICRNDGEYAKVAYKLAHELGHIALNHWREYSLIADVKFNDQDHRAVESQADAYACGIVYGSSSFASGQTWWKKDFLVERATNRRIDPGSFLLGFLREYDSKENWNKYGKWLRSFNGSRVARSLILTKLFHTVELGALGREAKRQLVNVTEAAEFVGPVE